MDDKESNREMKANWKAIFVGIIALLGFLISIHFTAIDRNIRVNGRIVQAPIVGFYGNIFKNGTVSVRINGEVLNAGSFDQRGYAVGDSIRVCYIPGEYSVIQERVSPDRYYFYFGLESVLLLMGIYLIVGGIMGKGKK